MKKIFSLLICALLVISGSMIGFASDVSEDEGIDPGMHAEIKNAYSYLNPGESTTLSNGMTFVRAIRDPRRTCPSGSGATYMGIMRMCYSVTGSYCNVKNYNMYECSRCGIVDGGYSLSNQDHVTGSWGCNR